MAFIKFILIIIKIEMIILELHFIKQYIFTLYCIIIYLSLQNFTQLFKIKKIFEKIFLRYFEEFLNFIIIDRWSNNGTFLLQIVVTKATLPSCQIAIYYL